MVELLGVPYSPWTEKARWALEVRGIPYSFRIYAPILGELALRRKLGRWRGNVSVPVLTDEQGHAVPDSAAIARWADGHGAGPTLFPAGKDVDRFIALSERGLDAGRALSLPRVYADPDSVRELVPRRLRRLPGSLWLGRFGVWRTLRKYGGHRADGPSHTAKLAGVLDELRAALGGKKTIFAELSFADLAMAQVLAYVAPPTTGLRLGKGARKSFANPELATRYADLVAWRDQLYATYRSAAPSA
jgi:glutathione S-transferase